MKRFVIALLAAVVAITFTAAADADNEGNKRKGKYIYRKVYKSCYDRGAVQSVKPPLNPDAKTQSEWTEVFNQKNFEQFGCQEEWNQLSDGELTDIYSYLYAHAADSPTPLKCK